MGWDVRRLVASRYRPYVTPHEAAWSMIGGPLIAATTIVVLGYVLAASWPQYWTLWVAGPIVGYIAGNASSEWMLRRARSRMRHERLD